MQLKGKDTEIERLANDYLKLNEHYNLILNRKTDLDDTNLHNLQTKISEQQILITELNQKLYICEQSKLDVLIQR